MDVAIFTVLSTTRVEQPSTNIEPESPSTNIEPGSSMLTDWPPMKNVGLRSPTQL